MNFLGVEGYRAKHAQAVAAREAIEAGVKALGFSVIGRPQLGLIAFTRDDVNCHAVSRAMYDKGWVSSITTEPKGLHLMLSPIHAGVTDAYLADLEAALAAAKAPAAPAEPARYGA